MKKLTLKRVPVAITLLSGTMLPLSHAAFAQSAQLEEVVVTARRNEESIQAVPISISALSGEALSDNKIESGASLQMHVPSLTIYSQTRDEETFAIRGLSGAGASAQGQAPSVTTYFAQVPLPTGDGGGPGRYFDLQNIQVLKGPQGTLFGRNSTGGAVLFEPQRPTNNLEGYIQAQAGNYADKGLEGAINLPLVDNVLTARVSVKTDHRDGFTHDITRDEWLDDRDYQSGRVSLLFTPSEHFENLLVADYFKSNTRGSSDVVLGINDNYVLRPDVVGIPGHPIPLKIGGTVTISQLVAAAGNPAAQGAAIAAAAAAGGFAIYNTAVTQGAVAQQLALGDRKVQSSSDHLDDIKAWGVADIATYSIADNLTFKNILGYRSYEQKLAYDFDGSGLGLLDQNIPSGPSASVAQITEEPQLQGTSFDDRLDWTVGAFAAYVHTPDTQVGELSAFGSQALKMTYTKSTSRSLYGQGTYDLGDFVDGLKLTLGYRYTKDHRSLDQTTRTNNVCTLPPGDPNVDFAACQFTMEKDFGAGSYTMGLDYQIDPDTLVYLAHRRGYRSGGLNTGGAQVGQSSFGPEYVTDIEAGIKRDWHFDNGVSARTNLAAFRTQRDDAQVSQSFAVVTNNQTNIVYLIVNEAQATIKGLEAEGQLALPVGLDLSVSYAYTDAKFDKYLDLASNTELKNQPYPFTPRNKLTANVRYTLPLPVAIGTVSASVNWSHSSSVDFNVAPDPFGQQPAYSQTDVFLNWKGIMQSTFDASIFVTNLANKAYLIGGIPTYNSAGFTSGVESEPRMWGASVKYTFKD